MNIARPPERVIEIDEPGLIAFLAIDSTRRGPAFGGIRRAAYPNRAAARADALRLARAMSQKCALAGLPAGGAKTVIMADDAADPDAIYDRLGEIVDGLNGAYVCGPDVGTGPDALARLRRATAHVNPPSNDASVATARGVMSGLRGLAAHLGAPLTELDLAVEGVGGVGFELVRRLLELGVSVTATDVRRAALERAAALGTEVVDGEAWASALAAADLYVPCALGGVLRPDRLPLRWRGVCGSANNLHPNGAAEQAFHEAGIAVVPDVVASAGAVIEGVLVVSNGEAGRAQVGPALAAIEARAGRLLAEAVRCGRPSAEVARAEAEALLRAP